MATLEEELSGKNRQGIWRQFPWWLVAILIFLVLLLFLIITNDEYGSAFNFVIGSPGRFDSLLEGELLEVVGRGLSLTLFITVTSFFISIILNF